MTQALVRAAAASDIPAIAAIYGASVLHGTASFELEPPDEAEMRRRYEAIWIESLRHKSQLIFGKVDVALPCDGHR